jgi:folate-binding protein YgfZ
MSAGPGGAPLDWLAVLEVRGADAASFLHAQFCGDVLGLPPGGCRFTAWCTPKGRVIASLLLARSDAGFRLFLCRDIAAQVLRRLRLFVLRARVELSDRTGELAVAGSLGSAPPLPGIDHAWHYAEQDGLGTAVLPGSAGPRWLLCGAPATLAGFGATRPAAGGWVLEDVRTGLPWIGAVLSEEFLPQELDLERLDGLSYRKGCFPGQEVIARVHARGRLKRALRGFSIAAAPPAAAARIVAADGTAAGLVITAAENGSGSSKGLAVVELTRAGGETLHILEAAGPVLSFATTFGD